MEKRAVIRISNVGKTYELGKIGGTTLQQSVQSWWAKKRGKEDPNRKIGQRIQEDGKFQALNDVSCTIYEGERVGIIGRNGAGKSTLLKLLSRVTAPSEGKLCIRGKISSMLEVGTGFHGELTGRENIYLNGAILGMDSKEVDEKIADIIEFSECEQFIDTPVKRYSSGMYVKLAFAVAAFLNADIFLMDEVLAVGDMMFQKKCLNKMRQISEDGNKTILYVSHNMQTIRELCDRCIVLENGKIIHDGDVETGISLYMQDILEVKHVYEFTENREQRFSTGQVEIRKIELDVPVMGDNVKNSFHWSEASGKVEAGAAVMGASSSGETNTGEILLRVLEAGEGVITFTAGSANTQLNDGPQFDKLDICKTELEVFGDQNSETLKSNASANSWHAGNQGATGDGVAAWAFDGKTNTWWHSNYSTTTSANINGAASANNAVWIQTGFNKSWSVKEIFYRARTDKANENAMMNYKVYIANLEDPSATPTDTDFGYPENPVAAGSLNGNIIDLGEFHDATHVRIAAVSSSNTNGFITATKIDFLGKEVEAPTPVEYTVTFDRQNGEEVTTQTVAENTELTLSETETPVREGYVFTGWYTDAECTEACEDTITVTADLTIYAGWTADKTALESAIAAAETVERENYTEESWNRFTAALEKAQEVKQDTAATAEAVSSAAEELTEAMGQLEVVTTFTVAATAENGTVTVNVPEGKTANALDAYDEVTVTAEAAEGYEFVYWMDKDTKVVLSENAEYTFVVVKNTNLEAVFAEKESEAVVVTFMTGDEFANQFVAAVTAEDGTVQLPEAKEYAGYEFAGWDTNGDGIAEIASDETTANVTESATWIAVYTAKETYTVTVTNGEIISGKQEDGSYELGSKLGVKAVKPEGTEGTFSGWYAGETLVSTNETYWFVVNAETELEARWSEAAVVAAEPVVRFSKTNRTTEASGKQKVEIALSWSAPKEGCTVLAEGILRTYKTGLEDQLTLGTTVSGITTNQCKSVGQNGTFTLTVNLGATSANRTKDITVRGYVRYMDASGEIHVAYTEPTVIAVPK